MLRWPLHRPGTRSGLLASRSLPLKVAAAYLICGVVWLFIAWIAIDHSGMFFIEDGLFVVCSSLVVFVLVRHGVKVFHAKESALLESEDRLARILETNASGIVVCDAGGRITYANHMACRVLGVDRAQIIGIRYDDPTWDLTDADGAPISPENHPVTRVRATGKPLYDVEIAVRQTNGSRVILTVNAAPLLDASGSTAGVVASFVDITERKKMEDLKIRKLLLAVEQSPSAIVITDLEGNEEYANLRYAMLGGCTVKDWLKGGVLHPCKISAQQQEKLHAAVRSGIAWHGEFECLRKGGEAYWESTTMTPIRTAEGEVTNLLWVREDVTARKQAEEELRRSEANYMAAQEKFRQLFEQNDEPVFLFRQGTCEVLDANPAAVHLYGYSRQELQRQGISLFVSPPDLPGFRWAIMAISAGAALSIDSARHRRKDGAQITVSIRANLVRTDEEEVVYGSFRDITARIRMEEEAKLHQAQLIHANRMTSLGTIVSGVAHEVNNPNNLVMFNAPMILSAWEDALPVLNAYCRENGDFPLGGLPYSEMREVVPKLVKGISDASARIKTIVANLKDFSRPEEPRKATQVDVNDVVQTAVSILNHEILKATHKFELACGEGLPPVTGSAQQLEQVVMNLVNNALQALPSNRRGIRVSTRLVPETGEVEVCVADEGMGMSPEMLDRIKEPFFSTRLDRGGLGLGVSICRSIIQDHGGTLDFESEEGKGTRVVFRLPGIAGSVGNDPGDLASKIPTGV